MGSTTASINWKEKCINAQTFHVWLLVIYCKSMNESKLCKNGGKIILSNETTANFYVTLKKKFLGKQHTHPDLATKLP
jgi:hypothetical protein